MAKFEEVLAPGLTIRESANDGSDFTNPTADYRRLFLGEDGSLHLKDSSGTVTAVAGGGGGAVATDAIWDAKGDLAGGTGANTAAKLTVGANGLFLMAASGETTGMIWATVPGQIIGQVIGTAGDQSITSSSLADLPTNLAVTFTVPASGNVLIRLCASVGATSTTNSIHVWGLRESTSIIAGATGESIAIRQMGGNEGFVGAVKEFVRTGLTPAASLTYKWAAACSTSGGTFKCNTNSPAIMTVIAL